jgi:hypothetical protein
MAWASRPFASWPLRLQTDGMEVSEALLVGGQPSRAWLEWTLFAPDVEGEFRERRLVGEVLDVCREHERPDVYVAFRTLRLSRIWSAVGGGRVDGRARRS